MVHFVELGIDRVVESTAVQGIVILRCSECSIRRMVPRQYHVEHAKEPPILYVANIADCDIAVNLSLRARIPQSEPMRQS